MGGSQDGPVRREWSGNPVPRHLWCAYRATIPFVPNENWGEFVLRTVLNGKIHRATVTQADLHYVGSLTIDADLMAAADVREGERV
jgi:hypothetical protein